jgi:MSHA pilin protein MshD
MKLFRRRLQRGATLVELVISIVIISVGLAGIVSVINRNVLSSADPMAQHQAVAIAEAYLEEILLKDFCDPNNAAGCTPGNAPGTANCLVCDAAFVEGGRASYDNVCDYNSLPPGAPADQNNNAITGLGNYSVSVSVLTNATLNTGAPTQLAGASCQVLRVEVTVTGPAGTYAVSGYRANY